MSCRTQRDTSDAAEAVARRASTSAEAASRAIAKIANAAPNAAFAAGHRRDLAGTAP